MSFEPFDCNSISFQYISDCTWFLLQFVHVFVSKHKSSTNSVLPPWSAISGCFISKTKELSSTLIVSKQANRHFTWALFVVNNLILNAFKLLWVSIIIIICGYLSNIITNKYIMNVVCTWHHRLQSTWQEFIEKKEERRGCRYY